MKSKRRRDHRIGSAAHLQVGLTTPSSSAIRSKQEDVDACLAELEQQVYPNTVVAPPSITTSDRPTKRSKVTQSSDQVAQASSTAPIKPEDSSDDATDRLWNPSFRCKPSSDALERIQHWNAALKLWITKGTYTPGLLPSFETEVARHFQVEKLSKYLLKTCTGLKMPAFERWLLDAKLEERQRNEKHAAHTNHSDCIIPNANPKFHASQRLVEEIMEAHGLDQAAANKTVKELCRQSEAAIASVTAQSRRYALKIPLHKGDRIELEKHDKIYSLLFASKSYRKPFCIRLTKIHYEKLRSMFLHTHNHPHLKAHRLGATLLGGKALHAFHYILMTVLLRYSSLSGGQLLLELRGGGMQGAIHGQVFEVLRQSFAADGPLFECFASPLNAYLPTFGSAFVDLDWHFGSVGDFLQYDVISGCCEANPPFTPGVMQAMVQRIEYSLDQANRHGKKLSFVVIVPTVPDHQEHMPCAKRFAGLPFRRMTSSPNLRMHTILPAREHGYIAGAQHLKTTRFKFSIFDTSVILLQSEASREDVLPDGWEERLREAFQSRHLVEAGGKERDRSPQDDVESDSNVGKELKEDDSDGDCICDSSN